jgi:hypothetical protein
MVTQEQLNTEIDLAKRIYLYYFDKYATLLTIGSDKYLSWYKDLCILYFLSKGLKSIRIEDGLMYIGDTEIDEDMYGKFCSDIREYVTSDISDIVYAELDIYGNIKDIYSPSTPPTIVTYQGFNKEPAVAILNIVMDNTTAITVPFDIADIDTNSIIITTSMDGDPIPMVAPEEEGVHFIGTVMYWHTYYELKAGDIVRIVYLSNVS